MEHLVAMVRSTPQPIRQRSKVEMLSLTRKWLFAWLNGSSFLCEESSTYPLTKRGKPLRCRPTIEGETPIVRPIARSTPALASLDE